VPLEIAAIAKATPLALNSDDLLIINP
jgi:hypothetical protein